MSVKKPLVNAINKIRGLIIMGIPVIGALYSLYQKLVGNWKVGPLWMMIILGGALIFWIGLLSFQEKKVWFTPWSTWDGFAVGVTVMIFWFLIGKDSVPGNGSMLLAALGFPVGVIIMITTAVVLSKLYDDNHPGEL